MGKNNVSNERLLKALEKKPEGQLLNPCLCKAIEKLKKGKKLNSREFLEIYSALFKPGPYTKFNNPEKWERVSREHSARNMIGYI